MQQNLVISHYVALRIQMTIGWRLVQIESMDVVSHVKNLIYTLEVGVHLTFEYL